MLESMWILKWLKIKTVIVFYLFFSLKRKLCLLYAIYKFNRTATKRWGKGGTGEESKEVRGKAWETREAGAGEEETQSVQARSVNYFY